MTDIVERLQLLQKHQQDNDAGEADDTIKALRAENARLRNETLEEAAKAAEGFPKNREWVPGSLYDTLRREVAQDIRRLK